MPLGSLHQQPADSDPPDEDQYSLPTRNIQTPASLEDIQAQLRDLQESIRDSTSQTTIGSVTAGRDAFVGNTFYGSSPQERQSRLHALLANHASFIQSRLKSFVGRDVELAEIRARIDTAMATGGYVTLTGRAGQGKSSMLARLVADLGPMGSAHHFIPFDARYDYQINLLRDLMARLILKYELSDFYVASESRPALCEFFPNLLSEVSSRGGQEVIFIDGLDQVAPDTDGTRDLSFLPTTPPPGIVLVLSTRPDDTLRPLELRAALGTAEYRLPNLSRADFDLVLAHYQVRLSPDLASRFYRVMGEHALYLDLVAQELQLSTADESEAIIARIADDPDNIFSLSIERLQRLGHRQWDDVLRPVFGLLLAAQEPLAPLHIQRILSLDSNRLWAGLIRLGGLLAEDGQGRRYLFHLKLREYLRADPGRPEKPGTFTENDQVYYHQRLVQWCTQGPLAGIWQDSPDPAEQARRLYARQHYINHLYHAADWRHLWEVLDAGGYGRYKLQHDPSTRSYAEDLEWGRSSTVREELDWEGALTLLPYLWRYTLLRCSLASQADNYPDELFEVLVLLGREQEALGRADLLTDPVRKAMVLNSIAAVLDQQLGRTQEARVLLLRVYDLIRKHPDHAMSALATFLKLHDLREADLTTQAISIARTTVAAGERSQALRMVAHALIERQKTDVACQLLAEAEEVAQTISEPQERATALAGVAEGWAYARQAIPAETVAGYIEDPDIRDVTFGRAAYALANYGQYDTAEVLIGKITSPERRIHTLGIVAQILATAGERLRARQLLIAAEAATQQILEPEAHAAALAKLARPLAAVEDSAQSGARARAKLLPEERVQALTAVARVSVKRKEDKSFYNILVEAEEVAGEIVDPVERTRCLEAVARVWLEKGEAALAQPVLTAAKRAASLMSPSAKQATILCNLSQLFAQAGQWEEAATVAREIQVPGARDSALRTLARELANSGQGRAALAAAQEINRPGDRDATLVAIAQTLGQAAQWADAEAATQCIESARECVKAMANLAQSRVRQGDPLRSQQLLIEAEVLARNIVEPTRRIKMLGTLARALAGTGQWEQARKLAEGIGDRKIEDRIYWTLIEALVAAGELSQAEACAYQVIQVGMRRSALANVAQALARAGVDLLT